MKGVAASAVFGVCEMAGFGVKRRRPSWAALAKTGAAAGCENRASGEKREADLNENWLAAGGGYRLVAKKYNWLFVIETRKAYMIEKRHLKCNLKKSVMSKENISKPEINERRKWRRRKKYWRKQKLYDNEISNMKALKKTWKKKIYRLLCGEKWLTLCAREADLMWYWLTLCGDGELSERKLYLVFQLTK